jgi:hypothetical protein
VREAEQTFLLPMSSTSYATKGQLAAVGGFALVAFGLLGVVALRAASPPTLAAARSATARARSPVCTLPLPLIISTDVDVDDVQAIGYLLNSPVFDVQGIVAESDGFILQFAGVANTMRITKRYGRPDIPVAFGPLLSVRARARRAAADGGARARRSSSRAWRTAAHARARPHSRVARASAVPPRSIGIDRRRARHQLTSLNGEFGNLGMPPDSIKPNSYLTDFVPLPFNSRPPEWRDGATLIIDLLKK